MVNFQVDLSIFKNIKCEICNEPEQNQGKFIIDEEKFSILLNENLLDQINQDVYINGTQAIVYIGQIVEIPATYDKDGKEDPIALCREQVFIKRDKINVHAIQDQLYRHKHGNHVTTCEETIDANKKQGRAQYENVN